MMNFRKWFPCQVGPRSLLSARPFNFFDDDTIEGGTMNQDMVEGSNLGELGSVSTNHPNNEDQLTETLTLPAPQSVANNLTQQNYTSNKKSDPIKKVESLRINFLRVVHRISESPNNSLVSQVLYRLHLASLIRSDSNKPETLNLNKSMAIATELESTAQTNLDFSFKILLLGRTGVGKSATLNSIFDRKTVRTDPFQPGTDEIQEITGTIKGIRITVIDTPGFSHSYNNQKRNRKLMLSIKHFIRKSRLDIVLYFERLDLSTNKDYIYSDYPLIKLVTDVFGPSIWLNTILVMTHSNSPIPEGPDGNPVNYENFVRYRTGMVQRNINRAISNSQIENQVILVENGTNPRYKKDWMNRLLLLCAATKVLAEANSILKFENSFSLSPVANPRLPSIPHLLSSLLKPIPLSDSNNQFDEISDNEELEDEYDKLPPIRILTKTQFERLSKEQKNSYLDELDYRETLYLKKQLREEQKRKKQSKDYSTSEDNYEHDSYDAMQVSDLPIPVSFDCTSPDYRYRCLVGTGDWWIFRPVLDPQGFDHDLGFDGINLEASKEVRENLNAFIIGQMSKDKRDFTVQSESSFKYTDLKDFYFLGGLAIQSTGSKDLVCRVHGDTSFKNLPWNESGAGFSVTKFGNMYFVGTKLEDSVTLGQRFRVSVNAGRVGANGHVANGGSLEVMVKGRDYPVRDEKLSFGATLISFENDFVLGGNFNADFRVGRGFKISAGANLNSRRLGQICFKIGTSDHAEIALIAVFTLGRALFRRKCLDGAD